MATKDEPILGSSAGTPAEVFAYCERYGRVLSTDERAAFLELQRLCIDYDIRYEVAIGQTDLETFDIAADLPWYSFWYRSRFNWGGLGITGDPQENDDSQIWQNAQDGARGYFLHLWGYTHAEDEIMPRELTRFLAEGLDERFSNIKAAGFRGIARTIDDLSNRWAMNPDYGAEIAGRINRIFGKGEEMEQTHFDIARDEDARLFGLAVTGESRHSTLSERDYLRRRCFTNRNGARPWWLIPHVQAGNTRGSLDWWVNGTDGDGDPIQASAHVMVNHDGGILRVIPDKDGAWTNGDVIQPTSESAELRALGGNPNIWTLTAEFEGENGDDVTSIQLEAGVWQFRSWMSKYPDIPLGNVIPHGSINSRDREFCPGSKILNAMRAGLKGWERPNGDTPPVTPPATREALPRGMSTDLAQRLFGSLELRGKLYHFDRSGEVSQAWLKRGKRSIPKGGTWVGATWPALEDVIIRGDKSKVFTFSDGWVYVQPAK